MSASTLPGREVAAHRRSWTPRLDRVRVGGALLLVVAAVVILGPFVAPHGETEFVGRPSTRHVDGLLFGTDHLGQDVLSRFLLGGGPVLLVAVAATAIGVSLGAVVGLLAAADHGRLDEALMRTVDVTLALPQFLLVLVAMTTLGPRTWLIVTAIAVTTVPRVARVTRGAAIPFATGDFVAASEAVGESRRRIARHDLLPNVTGALLVEANIRLSYAIGIVASLAFLGFTTHVNGANWGQMVNENRAALTVQPWGVVLPVIALVLVGLGSGLVADGMARTLARADEAR
jgi:peptide/nickel transport system permease protein